MKYSIFFLTLVTVCTILSCKKDKTINPLAISSEEIRAGGSNSVVDRSENAFGQKNPQLLGTDELLFFVGNSFFNQNWVSAPASTTARDGLGPIFNARSCSACHFKDGRGKPLQDGDIESQGFLMRIGETGTDSYGAPNPHSIYGGQLGTQSVLSDNGEGKVEVSWSYLTVTYPDGSSKQLRAPIYTIYDADGNVLNGIESSPRIGQQMIGLGLLEAISENDILANEDELDANNDGVSGKANRVYNYENNTIELGRFGWKANQPNLRQQVAGALVGDLGITSHIFQNENFTANQPQYANLPNGQNNGEPEIETDDFRKMVLYSSNLAVPTRRNTKSLDVMEGQQLFKDNNCTACHTQKFTTSTHPTFSALSNQTIYPYTDLLLHDMGDGLADNRPDFLANGNEWRTPPLWGVGLIETVNGHTNFLHDGRARDFEEAILWHGGESTNSINKFKALSLEERNKIITFLNSL